MIIFSNSFISIFINISLVSFYIFSLSLTSLAYTKGSYLLFPKHSFKYILINTILQNKIIQYPFTTTL